MDFPKDTLVIASHNAGKLREISALLGEAVREIRSAADFGLPSPPETETSFEGNARLKARFVAEATGFPALSDDSGLEVEALDGAPGVYTADWAETPDGRDFAMAMEKVWTLLEERGAPAPRRARFVCVLCLAQPDGQTQVWRGEVAGQIVWPMRGTRGFGFDPVFQPEGEVETFGEMDPDRKHRMSHRAMAFAKLQAHVRGG